MRDDTRRETDNVVRPAPMGRSADMNVTPLVDVLLVLLVIFMAALPLAQKGIDSTLPPQVSNAAAPEASQIVAEYTADHRLTVNKSDVAVGDAARRFREIFGARRDKTLYIIGDRSVRYGEIIRVIDAAKGAGVDRVGVITTGMRQDGGAAQ